MSEVHTCEKIPRGKTDPCGKKAKRSYEGKWYCGTEKSGCLKSIINKATKVQKSGSTNEKPMTKKEQKKSISDIKSQVLVHQITKTQKLSVKKLIIKNKVYWINHASRVVFDREKREAYGKLDKDNITIKKLDDNTVRWLEANGINIKEGSIEEKVNEEPSPTPKEDELEVLCENEESGQSEDEQSSQEEDIELEDEDDFTDDVEDGEPEQSKEQSEEEEQPNNEVEVVLDESDQSEVEGDEQSEEEEVRVVLEDSDQSDEEEEEQSEEEVDEEEEEQSEEEVKVVLDDSDQSEDEE